MALSCLRRTRVWLVPLAIALWAQANAVHAAALLPAESESERLAQVDSIRTTDHARFVEGLGQLHRDAANLTVSEKRYLRYLDGWESNYEGRYPEAEAILRDVMVQADDDALGTRATAMLMNNLSEQGKYAEAYAIATRAADTLPVVNDPVARFVLLANLSQMLTFAGQPDLGLKYADMMLEATPAGQSVCQAMVQKVTALEGSRELTSSSPELLKTIETCTADGQPIFANTMSLILVDRLYEERRLTEALAAIKRIEPGIQASQYFPHVISLASQRAQIYEQMGKVAEARKAALETVAMGHAGDINEALRFAYRVLYSIEKAQGHHASALNYYEHYVIQDQGYLRDANVRNAAYEAARQHFRAEKLETEGLGKENRILRLQQALDAKAVETSRLYIVVMSLVLLSIIFWMLRIKRSQLRFKWLSSCDGLTGIFHHQHFMSESERALQVLEKRSGDGCLVFLDLDHFKHVNDTHGHAVGDAVLKHAVATCKGQLRKADLFGRLGGEEFGMLLMDTPRLQGTVVAERIRVALAASPLIMDGLVISFSASIGLACTDITGYDLQRLCRAADAALYRAKRKGRNSVVTDSEEGGRTTSLSPPSVSADPRTA
ncbi:MAG TPA: GGDEF domain-containing protein [Luteibacter sp.]|uniref:GGDEF domain-containing protein n=1 Tax=Luteibacter sp. TaxID=1886636 RepID=UPI002D0894CC|nr:GGDEF domain-containing protein [Luteibacter sp.]HVI55704.1 GGDEF domain-containing protein [Luteibacter sp.]